MDNPDLSSAEDIAASQVERTLAVLRDDGLPEHEPAIKEAVYASALVARACNASLISLTSPTRDTADVATARMLAMYLVHTVCRRSLTDVGRVFGRDRTTASHACKTIEDARDNPIFDWLADRVEASLRTALGLEAP